MLNIKEMFGSRKNSNPESILADAKAKIAELKENKATLEDRLTQLEDDLKAEFVNDALGSKTAADKIVKLETEIASIKGKIYGAGTAIAEIEAELPGLAADADAYEAEQADKAVKNEAKVKLRLASDAYKKAVDAAETYAQAMSQLAEIDSFESEILALKTHDNILDEFQKRFGHRKMSASPFAEHADRVRFTETTGLEAIKVRLNKVAEQGSTGRTLRHTPKPTEAEIAEMRSAAFAKHNAANIAQRYAS